MNAELRAMRALTTHLPPIKGMGAIANILRAYYTRRKREPVQADVLGNRMELDPQECVDSELLFYPQLYDRPEITYLRHALKPGDVFLDIGSNIGIYSLVAAQTLQKKGRVIAIEADPYNFAKLQRNCELSEAKIVQAVNVGVSDKKATLELAINETGNRGGNSFLRHAEAGKTIKVDCLPLTAILKQEGVTRVAGAKLDIEGFEFRVLKAFFADTDRALWPGFIILEHTPTEIEMAGGDAIALLREQGYTMKHKTGMNCILKLA